MGKKNVIISGLTAAGKTTHSHLLAAELDYRYLSATEVMADMIGIPRSEAGPGFWQKYGNEIRQLRDSTDLDLELDRRMLAAVTEDDGTVIDAWALAWLSEPGLGLCVWLESDLRSRTMKAAVSDESRHQLEWYADFITDKDSDTRERFLHLYDFDLYGDRERFDIELDNSSYITNPTRVSSNDGIARFHPTLSDAVRRRLSI